MKITLTREEAQQVLDALIKTNAEWKHLADSGDAGNWVAEDQDHYQQCDTAIEILRARLAQPEQRTGNCLLTSVCAAEGHRIQKAQRGWQGLTDEELLADGDSVVHSYDGLVQFARAIEAKLKEKNT